MECNYKFVFHGSSAQLADLFSEILNPTFCLAFIFSVAEIEQKMKKKIYMDNFISLICMLMDGQCI